jgi:hypothetical protein
MASVCFLSELFHTATSYSLSSLFAATCKLLVVDTVCCLCEA